MSAANLSPSPEPRIFIRYGDEITVDRQIVAELDWTRCCGVGEIHNFQTQNEDFPIYSGTDHAEKLAYALSKPKTIMDHTSHCQLILAVVEDWATAPSIIDALIIGGWKQTMKPTLNPNSTNTISTWMYTK